MTVERATPYVPSALTTLTGGSDALFPAAAWADEVTEVLVSNPSATNTIWIAFDQAAAANAAGSIPLGPLQTASFLTISAVNVLGTAASKVTGYQRKA